MPKLSDRWYKQQLIAPPIPTSSRRLLDRSPAIGIAGGPSSADGHGVKVGVLLGGTIAGPATA